MIKTSIAKTGWNIDAKKNMCNTRSNAHSLCFAVCDNKRFKIHQAEYTPKRTSRQILDLEGGIAVAWGRCCTILELRLIIKTYDGG